MPKLPQQVRVLVVDDDKAICEFMETFLTADGFEVTTLNDPQAVEDTVRAGGYHLLVLDLMMPKMDGVEVLERVRRIDKDIAVVIFTGYPSLDPRGYFLETFHAGKYEAAGIRRPLVQANHSHSSRGVLRA